MMKKATNKTSARKQSERTATKTAIEDVEIDRRAIEAVDALGLPAQMRLASSELAQSWDYEEEAAKAGVLPEIVRAWTLDPAFVQAVGWVVIGLADNHE